MSETFSQRIKEDVARFVSDPTREGLQELIRYFGGEFDQYELKEAWPDVPRIAKTTLAIANSGGGIVIFGIQDATLEPVGLREFMSKQQVFDTFRTYIPVPLLNDITLLDFDYAGSSYAPIRGKLIQVLAIPDLPHAIPFVCENDWRNEDSTVRRGAIYVRSGTNTREADYGQLQHILDRRIAAENPLRAAGNLSYELAELHALYAARARAEAEGVAGHGDGVVSGEIHDTFEDLIAYLDDLIAVQKKRIREDLNT
jgi:hypothetical protein